MVGAMMLASGAFRLGGIANLLSVPVMVGFLAGISVHIIVSQLPGVLGLPSPSGPTLERIGVLATELGRTNPFTLCIGLGVLAVVFIAERVSAKIPGALIGLVAATLATIALGLESKGVSVVGAVPGTLPRPTLPDLAPELWVRLVPLAFVITGRGDGADGRDDAVVPVRSRQACRCRSRFPRCGRWQRAVRPVRRVSGQCQPAANRDRRRDRRTIAARGPCGRGNRAGAARVRDGAAAARSGRRARRHPAVRGAADHPGEADRHDLPAIVQRVPADRRHCRADHRAADPAGRLPRHRAVAAARHLEHDARAARRVRARAAAPRSGGRRIRTSPASASPASP
ncbi:hypothetical protein ACVW0J_003605 [Bradyrhizobium sp. i1.7.7]